MTQGNSTAQYNVNQYMQGNIATGVNIVDPQKAIILKGSSIADDSMVGSGTLIAG